VVRLGSATPAQGEMWPKVADLTSNPFRRDGAISSAWGARELRTLECPIPSRSGEAPSRDESLKIMNFNEQSLKQGAQVTTEFRLAKCTERHIDYAERNHISDWCVTRSISSKYIIKLPFILFYYRDYIHNMSMYGDLEKSLDFGGCTGFHYLRTWQKKFLEGLIAYFPWYDTNRIENDVSNNYSIVACVFVTTVTFLPSRCLETIGGFYRTEQLPSKDTGIHIQTRRCKGFFNQAVEMGSGAVIYIPRFIKIGSGIQKLIRGIHRLT
jgi:hypothetical protein